MASNYYAAVTCPVCGTQFQTPIEQIIDVRVDPEAKNRVISGSANLAVCPRCRSGGRLNLPFIYHDPDNDVALLYLPMEVGRTEVQRQQAAGTLTRQLMDSIPQEERKGYLLQPETFVSVESLVKRVLELEGITEEDMARNQQQREFLRDLLEAPREQWGEIVEQRSDLLDETFFGLLEYTLQLAAMAGPDSADFQKMRDAHDYLVQETELGRYLMDRSRLVQSFTENPTRETLLQALVDAPDNATRRMLIQSGMPLMDYAFFQALLKRKDAASDPAEQQRLLDLRKQIMDQREEMMKASEELAAQRINLIEMLLKTEDPLKMAHSHLSELDDSFFFVLRTQIESAQQAGDQALAERLKEVAGAVNQVIASTLPPEFVLLRSLIVTPDDAEREAILQENQEMLAPSFFQLLMMLEETSRERGDVEEADELSRIRAQAAKHAPQAAEEATQIVSEVESPPSAAPSGSEKQTPSGLIIAKK